MRKLSGILVIAMILISCSAQAQLGGKLKKGLNKVGNAVTEGASGVADKGAKFTEEEAAAGLREALTKGAEKGAALVSKEDGYFKNLEIKIPLPEEAQNAEAKVRKIPLKGNKLADDAIESINRAAELAGKEAKSIFVEAIKNMSVKDAIGIIKGAEDAGTQYLNQNTHAELTKKFRPIIDKAIETAGATKHYGSFVKAHNKLPGVTKLNPDLGEYVTEKAIAGLFVMIKKEEKNIRENLSARTSDLLKKIFG